MKNAGRRDRYITHRAETLTQDDLRAAYGIGYCRH